MVWLLPPQPDVCAAHLTGHQTAGLAGHTLLCLHLDRRGERPRADACVGLHPDSVDGVWGEVTDGGQLIVVNKLRLPLGQGELGLGGVINLKIKLRLEKWQAGRISHTSEILPIFDIYQDYWD